MGSMSATRIISAPTKAGDLLKNGALVAVPTETVYGLAARADDEGAVARIFAAKDRPADNPLIVHVCERSQVESFALGIPDWVSSLMDAFWPGPLSIVLPAKDAVPRIVTAGLDTVAVRMPDHTATLSALRHAGVAVAAPSANRSGRPSPTTWEAVRDDLDGRIEAILKSGPTTVGLESTVVDCTGEMPVILRPGAIGLVDLQSIHPGSRLLQEGDEVGRSPGVRHRHYRPNASVEWVGPFGEGATKRTHARRATDDDQTPVQAGGESAPWALGSPESWGFIGLNTPPDASSLTRLMVVENTEAYAHELFRFFRDCERAGIQHIACERIPIDGIGRALTDRINRASGTE